MKVLVAAHGCSARGGSEGYFGWSAARCLGQDHELWVLTSSRNREDLEEAQREGLVGRNVHFVFLGGPYKPWPNNRLIARLQSWQEYWTFSKLAFQAARELHRDTRFDLAHHVTIATWRVGSHLWKLGVPFVFGPIGGNEKFPLRFFSILSFKAKLFEIARSLSNTVSRFSPSVRACLRNASYVLAANRETLSLVSDVRRSNVNVSTLIPGFYSPALIERFAQTNSHKELTGPLRLFSGGNLEGRKGVALAFKALAEAKTRGLDFRYRIGGGGPEREYLEALADELGLRGKVLFGEPLVGDAYRAELRATHIFLLPSLRESAGLTMMEAMLAECMPIVADCGSPAEIVTNECGFKLPIASPSELIARLTDLLVEVDRNRAIILEKGKASAARIASCFSEELYRQKVNAVYNLVTSQHEKPTR